MPTPLELLLYGQGRMPNEGFSLESLLGMEEQPGALPPLSPWSRGGTGGAFGGGPSLTGGFSQPMGALGFGGGGSTWSVPSAQAFGGGSPMGAALAQRPVAQQVQGAQGRGGLFAQIIDGGIIGSPDHDGSMTDWFAPRGTQVKSPVGGVVQRVGQGYFGGVGLVLQGDDGGMWEFRHGSGTVQPGTRVQPGQPVFTIDDGSLPAGYQHVDIRRNGQGATPMLRQAGAQAELKPTSGPSHGGNWMANPPMGGGGGGGMPGMGGMGGFPGMGGMGMPGMMGGNPFMGGMPGGMGMPPMMGGGMPGMGMMGMGLGGMMGGGMPGMPGGMMGGGGRGMGMPGMGGPMGGGFGPPGMGMPPMMGMGGGNPFMGMMGRR